VNPSDSLYAELKGDMSAISEPLFDYAEKSLRALGNFLPYAAVLTVEGNIEVVSAIPETPHGMTSSTQVLPLLHQSLRAMAKEKQLLAIGIAENVTVTPAGKPATDAIKVLIEHSRGLNVAVYLPFRKRLFRGYSFDESFSILVSSEVNPWTVA
jgi:hypothetical protein